MRVLLWLLVLTLAAAAHPLGQLTADSVTTLTFTPTGLKVRYVVNFGEAAAFTRLEQTDRNRDGKVDDAEKQAYIQANVAHFAENMRLTLDGKPLVMGGGHGDLAVEDTPSGLRKMISTYEYEVPYAALTPGPKHKLEVSDASFQGVDGWREIASVGEAGVGLLTAPTPPKNAVEAMQTEAVVEFHLGPGQVFPRAPSVPQAETGWGQERLMGFLREKNVEPRLIVMALGLAFLLGALHALTPGHGKTLVGAYLIGSRGTVSQAVLLGVVVTVTHTFSVFLLGLGCLLAFQYVMPEKIIPWIGFASGILITLMGLFLLKNRDVILAHDHSHDGGHSHSHWPGAAAHSHDHGHSHSHYAGTTTDEVGGHDHGDHSHGTPTKDRLGLMGLLSLGISGGMVPCPDALVVLLSAIALNRLWFGMAILVAFSAGLACVLVMIGILMVTASRLFERTYPSDALVRRITTVSYGFIVVVGLVIAFTSLRF